MFPTSLSLPQSILFFTSSSLSRCLYLFCQSISSPFFATQSNTTFYGRYLYRPVTLWLTWSRSPHTFNLCKWKKRRIEKNKNGGEETENIKRYGMRVDLSRLGFFSCVGLCLYDKKNWMLVRVLRPCVLFVSKPASCICVCVCVCYFCRFYCLEVVDYVNSVLFGSTQLLQGEQ